MVCVLMNCVDFSPVTSLFILIEYLAILMVHSEELLVDFLCLLPSRLIVMN